jgi:hypothetical protein
MLPLQPSLAFRADVHAFSASPHHGDMLVENGTAFELQRSFASPRGASLAVSASLAPSGGVSAPPITRAQPRRPAASHALLAWTPSVYPNHRTAWFAVACRDRYGDARAADCAPAVSVSGALAAHAVVSGVSTLGGTQLCAFSLAFDSADAFDSGTASVVTVRTELGAGDAQEASFSVQPWPAWAGSSAHGPAAGIYLHPTSDEAGTWPTDQLQAGETFYLQLRAVTGGEGLTSWEIKLRHDPSVCEVVPASGAFTTSFTAGYTGPVGHSLDASYSTQLARRLGSPGDPCDFFVMVSAIEVVIA